MPAACCCSRRLRKKLLKKKKPAICSRSLRIREWNGREEVGCKAAGKLRLRLVGVGGVGGHALRGGGVEEGCEERVIFARNKTTQ